MYLSFYIWAPCWLSGKESACQYRRCGFDPWFRKIPWRRKWQTTPVFLLGKFNRQRRLAGYIVHGIARVQHDLATKPSPTTIRYSEWENERDDTHTTFITVYCYNCSILLLVIIANLFQFSLVQLLSHIWFFVTLWTVAHQAPLSMGLSR